jgi:hypothetical protein
MTISALAIDPSNSSTLYASTGRGVSKSTDGGQNWTPTGLTDPYVSALALDPTDSSTLYAGSYRNGAYKSTDSGGHWTAMNLGLTNLYISALALDPTDSSTLYAGTAGGVFDIEQDSLSPTLLITPDSLDFGMVTVGSTEDMSFTVQNISAGTLTGTASATAPFSIVSGGSFNLMVGQSQQVTVRFSPTAPNTFISSATFTSSAGNAFPPIRGVGVQPPLLSVTPAIDFGQVIVGRAKDMTLTVQNAGGGTLTGTASADAPFKIAAGSPFNVAAGQRQAVTVRFRPTMPGTVISNASFTSNGGTASPALSGVGVQPPQLSVTPVPLDFGLVAVGSTKDLHFTVQNAGGGILTGSCTANGPFSFPGGCSFTLAAGKAQVFRLRFSPTTAGVVTQQVPFTSNGGRLSPTATGDGTVKPHIDSLSPTSRPAGTSVLIRGFNFGATQGTSTVKFGAKVASATYWSNTTLKVLVPALPPGTYTVTVTTNKGTSNAVAFTVQ